MESEFVLKLEEFLKNYTLDPAIDKARIGGPLYTLRNVWGNEVRYFKHIEGKDWEVVSYKLHNYYATVEFTEDDARLLNTDDLIDTIAQEIRKQNIKMFGGKKFLDLPITEKNKYTCHQLCDWVWLIDEDGMLLHERKKKHRKTIYSATLAKYAVVIDKNGKEVDIDENKQKIKN